MRKTGNSSKQPSDGSADAFFHSLLCGNTHRLSGAFLSILFCGKSGNSGKGPPGESLYDLHAAVGALPLSSNYSAGKYRVSRAPQHQIKCLNYPDDTILLLYRFPLIRATKRKGIT